MSCRGRETRNCSNGGAGKGYSVPHFCLPRTFYQDLRLGNVTLKVTESKRTSQNICLKFFTFIGPCIVIYSYSKTNKMHLFLKIFILVKYSTCFGRSFHLSSGAQDCTYSIRHMSNSWCYLLVSGDEMEFFFQIIYSCKTLYMFWTVFPSIIRSTRLHIQHQAYVKQLPLTAC